MINYNKVIFLYEMKYDSIHKYGTYVYKINLSFFFFINK